MEYCSGTLESMKIMFATVLFNQDYTEKYPSIKKLEFDHISFPPEMLGFISTSFPKLNWLSIQNCLDVGNNLSFPDHHFSYFEIHQLRKGIDDGGTHIKLVINGSKNPWYYSRNFNGILAGSLLLQEMNYPHLHSPRPNKNYMQLICAPLEELAIDRLPIFLIDGNSNFKSLE